MAYKHLVPDPAEDNLKMARILGWCIEFVSYRCLLMTLFEPGTAFYVAKSTDHHGQVVKTSNLLL